MKNTPPRMPNGTHTPAGVAGNVLPFTFIMHAVALLIVALMAPVMGLAQDTVPKLDQREIWKIKRFAQDVSTIKVTPDGRFIIYPVNGRAEFPNTRPLHFRRFDARTGDSLARHYYFDSTQSCDNSYLHMLPEQNQMVVHTCKTLKVVDCATWQVVKTIPTDTGLYANFTGMSSNGRYISRADLGAMVVDVAAGDTVFGVRDTITDRTPEVLFSKDNTTCAVSYRMGQNEYNSRRSTHARVFDLATRKVLMEWMWRDSTATNFFYRQNGGFNHLSDDGTWLVGTHYQSIRTIPRGYSWDRDVTNFYHIPTNRIYRQEEGIYQVVDCGFTNHGRYLWRYAWKDSSRTETGVAIHDLQNMDNVGDTTLNNWRIVDYVSTYQNAYAWDEERTILFGTGPIMQPDGNTKTYLGAVQLSFPVTSIASQTKPTQQVTMRPNPTTGEVELTGLGEATWVTLTLTTLEGRALPPVTAAVSAGRCTVRIVASPATYAVRGTTNNGTVFSTMLTLVR